jgi:predicted metalloenzyme YecM
MKTAMQELMDALNDLETVYLQNDWRREVIGINQAKNLIEHIYLKKEKEQIMEAYDAGYSHCLYGIHLNDEYYYETFDTNEK